VKLRSGRAHLAEEIEVNLTFERARRRRGEFKQM